MAALVAGAFGAGDPGGDAGGGARRGTGRHGDGVGGGGFCNIHRLHLNYTGGIGIPFRRIRFCVDAPRGIDGAGGFRARHPADFRRILRAMSWDGSGAAAQGAQGKSAA
jgi:hypothetical protein